MADIYSTTGTSLSIPDDNPDLLKSYLANGNWSTTKPGTQAAGGGADSAASGAAGSGQAGASSSLPSALMGGSVPSAPAPAPATGTTGTTASLGAASATPPVAGISSQLATAAKSPMPRYDVNDPNFLNQSPQDRLNAFKSDSSLAQQELQRVKGLYDAEYAKGTSANQSQLSVNKAWADQVRQAAGISANDPFYGNGAAPQADGSLGLQVNGQSKETTPVYQGTAYDGADKLAQALGVSYGRDPRTGMPIIGGKTFDAVSFDANGNPVVPTKLVAEALGYKVGYDDKTKTVNITGQQPVASAPSGPSTQGPSDYLSQIMQAMPQQPVITPFQAPDVSGYQSQMMPYQQFNPDFNSYYSQAQSMLHPQYQQKYNDLMATLDKQVQAANESMNRRGIFNSGIAQAAENDLRAKTTNSVASVFMTEQGAIEKQAQQLYSDAYKQVLQGNQFALKNNEFYVNQMMADRKQAFTQWLDTQKLSQQQYSYALNAWDKMSSFIQQNAKMAVDDAHFQQNMDFNQFKFDNLSAQQSATLQQQYDKMAQDMSKALLPYQQATVYQQGQLDLKQQAQEAANYFKQQGINIDAAKLEEVIRHNQAGESLDSKKFSEKTAYDQAQIDKASAAATDTMKRTQLEGLKSQLSNVSQQINSYLTAKVAVPQDLLDNYNSIMSAVDSVISPNNTGMVYGPPAPNSSSGG